MSQLPIAAIATVGIDIGKNTFHVVGLDQRCAIVLRQKWSRSQARFANMPPCLIGMEACVGAHHLSLAQRHIGALDVGNDPFFGARRDQLVALAASYTVNRRPT
jgi:hypothetical protein